MAKNGCHVCRISNTIFPLLKPIVVIPNFRQNSENPLAADLVVVDEASMMDLVLMSKLVQTAAPEVRLVLIGDKYQLASALHANGSTVMFRGLGAGVTWGAVISRLGSGN